MKGGGLADGALTFFILLLFIAAFILGIWVYLNSLSHNVVTGGSADVKHSNKTTSPATIQLSSR